MTRTDDNVDMPDVLDRLGESVLRLDRDGRVLAWNRAAECLYGWPREQALGRSAAELFGEGNVLARHASDSTDAAEAHAELTRRTAGGKPVIVDVRQFADGAHGGILEIGRDLTDARRAQKALRENEYRYRNLFHAMAASFWELDFNGVGAIVGGLRAAGTDDVAALIRQDHDMVRAMMRATRVLDVNEQSVDLFGGGRREVFSNISVEPFWPQDSTAVYAASVVAAISGKPHYVAETRLRDIDGREFDVLFTACFPPESVAKGKLLVGIIDISERRRAFAALERSEQRYKALFQHMPIALLQLNSTGLIGMFENLRAQGVTDLDAYIDAHPGLLRQALDSLSVEEVNQRAVQLLGADNAEQCLGPPTPYWTHAMDTFRRSLLSRYRGDPLFDEEMRAARLDGGSVDVQYILARPDALNKMEVSLVGLVDLSERNRTQEMLRRAQSDLAHAARVSVLGELTASIAHEVNQPLAAIATHAEAGLRWLDRPVPDVEEVRTLTGRIVEDARRAAGIIARMRSMAVRRAPAMSPLSLHEVIAEAMLFLQHEVQSREVAVKLHLRAASPQVSADRIQLQQVLVNLAVNAIQSMANAGTHERQLRILTDMADSTTIRCSVEDSGPGVAAADLDHLFEHFFSTKEGGMGMGLPICRSIIEAHGGRIQAGNRTEGTGAVFRFELPVA